MKLLLSIACLSMLALTSCMGSRFSTVVQRGVTHPIEAVAMDPGGGVLADAIALELFNYGVTVYDTSQTRGLLVRLDLSELEVIEPTDLGALRAQGIDAYIVVRTVAGHDARPESASVRVTSTHDSTVVSGFSWQNGWGGNQGSPSDRWMRSNLASAAKKIGRKLAKQLDLSR